MANAHHTAEHTVMGITDPHFLKIKIIVSVHLLFEKVFIYKVYLSTD